jgi:hypothetical protein
MTPTPSPAASRARGAWESFLLKDNEHLAESYPGAVRDEVRALALAGSARADVAERLREGHIASALTLFREAAIFYMASFVASRTGETPAEPLRGDDVLARFRAIAPDAPAASAPELRAAFLDAVRASDPRAVERLTPSEALLAGQTASAVVRSLAALVEPRSVSDIRFVRRARVASLGLAALALVVWLVAGLLGRTNLALHKPVATSGVHPAGTSPPAGLTDGITSGGYGVHTAVAALPWVSVDLLGVHVVDEVKVYNRGDGWYNDGLPMTVQLSEDGTNFVDVATRTATFGQQTPWTIEMPRQRARYVRVRGGSGKYVALSELEVFGDRP